MEGIWPKKKRVRIGVVAPGKVLSAELVPVDSIWNTTDRFYGTSPVARHANHMFWIKILCHLAFYIKEIKSALSVL